MKLNGKPFFYIGPKSYIDIVETPQGLNGGSAYGGMFIPNWVGQLKTVQYPTALAPLWQAVKLDIPLSASRSPSQEDLSS